MFQKKRFILIGIMLCLLFLSACNGAEESQAKEEPESSNEGNFQAEYDWILPDFNYINQDNEKVSKTDLMGEVWLANFVFTNCQTVCPPMTMNMAKLQERMKEEGLNNRIISFSVDPDRDTPEALKEYASIFEADHSNWDFLTGYEQEEVQKLAKAFKTLAEPEEGTDQFIHSTKTFLINKEGVIVKGYDGYMEVPFDEIIQDLKALN